MKALAWVALLPLAGCAGGHGSDDAPGGEDGEGPVRSVDGSAPDGALADSGRDEMAAALDGWVADGGEAADAAGADVLPAVCGAMTGTCAIQSLLDDDSGADCPPTIGLETFALNAGASQYTTNGFTCDQSVQGCQLQRTCTSSIAGAANTTTIVLTFASGAFAGTDTVSVTLGSATTLCTYALSGRECSADDGG